MFSQSITNIFFPTVPTVKIHFHSKNVYEIIYFILVNPNSPTQLAFNNLDKAVIKKKKKYSRILKNCAQYYSSPVIPTTRILMLNRFIQTKGLVFTLSSSREFWLEFFFRTGVWRAFIISSLRDIYESDYTGRAFSF